VKTLLAGLARDWLSHCAYLVTTWRLSRWLLARGRRTFRQALERLQPLMEFRVLSRQSIYLLPLFQRAFLKRLGRYQCERQPCLRS